MRMRVWPIAIALFACGGGPAAPPAAPKQPDVDERKAEKDAKGLLTEIYQSIGHGDTDGLMSLLAEPLVVFGPRRGDALGTRADALVALKEKVDPKSKSKPQLQSSELTVVASPGGHSAWAVDVVTIAGEPHVVTCVLSNNDDLWNVTAVSLANTPSMKQVRAELKQEAVVPPGMAGVAKSDANAKGAADKLMRGLNDQKIWGDDLETRTDSVVIGPALGDITRGKKDIKKMWAHRLKANVREAVVGEVTAATTPDGQIAWASASVVRFEDDDDPLPLRVFAVFERSKAGWTMIALHESVALDEAGVGANFKKIAAPALPVVAPPPEVKKESGDTKKETKKKKKKKKKKASADDE
jgi:ketosteroid isomerase-like protein